MISAHLAAEEHLPGSHDHGHDAVASACASFKSSLRDAGVQVVLPSRSSLARSAFLEMPTGAQSISCQATGADVRFAGPFARVLCPASCQQDAAALALGSTIHPLRSAVCAAAIVDRTLPIYGGELLLTKLARGLPSYTGKDVNFAVSLSATGEQGGAFQTYGLDHMELPAALPAVKPLGCSGTFSTLGILRPGISQVVRCRGGCAGHGVLEGTGAYTGASSVCRAAQHAGAIGSEGGHVVVTAGHGQDAFFGARGRDDDLSADAHEADESFTVAVPTAEFLARTKAEPTFAGFL